MAKAIYERKKYFLFVFEKERLSERVSEWGRGGGGESA